MSSSRSSALSSALSATSSSFSSRTLSMAISTRSRTIDSTSRPTYPTSVNFEASTFRNGELASFASRRAISVFPTPVGPIIIMFLGMISSASSGVSFWRRMRLRSAIATARFASFCPITCLSSSTTISRGVSSSSANCSSSAEEGRYMAIDTHVWTAALGCPAGLNPAIFISPAQIWKISRASLDRTAEGGCPHMSPTALQSLLHHWYRCTFCLQSSSILPRSAGL